MSVKKIKVARYLCKCEAVDPKTNKVCGHEWESDVIPERCALCKRYTWNHATVRKQIKAFGRSQPLSDWSREFGLDRRTISARLKNGWKIEDALKTPVQGAEA